MTVCPYCGTRQDLDLRQFHFRDLGTEDQLPCPECDSLLSVIEFDTQPPIRVERCATCFGMFFNPGELEGVLEAGTAPAMWVDSEQIARIAEQYGFRHEVVYLPCPFCGERMSHVNFGGRSGVILDRCGTHGFWLNAGELRRLLEWWRAGGRLLHQQDQIEQGMRHKQRMQQMRELPGPGTGSASLPEWTPETTAAAGVGGLIAGLVSSLLG